MQAYFLVVDTETSGLPKNWTAPYSKEKNWPHIVQIAWIIYDQSYQEIKRENHYIKNTGFTIDKAALKIHKITPEYLNEYGENKENVMLKFSEDIEKYKPLVIGHFIELDYHMVNVELYRIGKENIFKNLTFFCTMKASAPYITNTVISHLKLDKFYTVLFNELPENSHNALSDTLNTAKIFFHLLKTGKISLTSAYHQEHTFNLEKKKKKNFRLKEFYRDFLMEDKLADQIYTARIGDITFKKIVSCSPGTPIFEAAIKMSEQKTSCLFIKSDQDVYLGFVTDITLRDNVIAKQLNANLPIDEVMDTNIVTITPDAYVYEAILMMFSKKSRYLLVNDNGNYVGFLSRNRLLSEQAESPLVFIQSVKSAVNTSDLKLKWQKVPGIVSQLLTRGVHSKIVNEVITTIADTISFKIIEEVIAKLGPPPAKFVFMVLGSEGRKELSLKTDQDNAIIYEDTGEENRAAVRSYFLDLATQVSDKLNFVGFVYCDGDYMATNPNWTHSLSHWKYNYKNWIEEALPEAAVKFAAFFDCRAIYGDLAIMESLRSFVDEELQKPIEKFYVYLAKNALLYEPPLTYFRNIRTQKIHKKEVFDIKTAMTPIVDLARVYALQNRIFQKENTGERLKALRELGVFSEEQFNELSQSYYYLMGLRLKHQANLIINDQAAPNNFIEIDSLTKIEKVTLIEIFKIILNFQSGIRMRFTNSLG